MRKLTKKQKADIGYLMYHIGRAQDFIMHPDTTVCRPFGCERIAITKDIGSDLCGLDFAMKRLYQMMKE
jgi:hypothetical protein